MSDKKHEKISEELLEMGRLDQEMQDQALENASNLDFEVLKKHTKQLRDIVNKIGWPTEKKVGQEASEAAFLIVQHADHNPAFQEEALDMLKELPEEEVEKYQVAYLEDRVRVAEGKDQLYGTQFQEDEQGRLAPYPIKNETELDKRRVQMGLPPFDDYLAELKEMFHGEVVW